ncbi:hypothetical protein F5148DRAFT_511 [Russula earlei]|uniref:Uncharacterized protein n=1 Tax=Russula earlei TaxID=71964 RepID=A0ACC0URF3_9AGAM|nr:hypothetical protein F5148DRAFT_511 [Russula earlei]
MTRTERSHTLRALLKDRSEARNGMDSSVPKGGAGAYNWGSLDYELDYENAAMVDEFEDQAAEGDDDDEGEAPLARPSHPRPKKPVAVRRMSSGVTDQDRENAIRIRKNALKSNNGEINLADIARSSVAVSGSPPKGNPLASSSIF